GSRARSGRHVGHGAAGVVLTLECGRAPRASLARCTVVRGSSVQPSNASLLRRRDGVLFQILIALNLRGDVEMPAT
ncbi:hypothetical protein, partial [Paraburkholderia sp. SIMBA_030]|uniref:hypothetical protein n=1 Tax=Paraburkholderia sp. SIMBA_030 TaxID=3085773 RepID=UPI00397E6F69